MVIMSGTPSMSLDFSISNLAHLKMDVVVLSALKKGNKSLVYTNDN